MTSPMLAEALVRFIAADAGAWAAYLAYLLTARLGRPVASAAALAEARGMDPDAPPNLSKVTRTV